MIVIKDGDTLGNRIAAHCYYGEHSVCTGLVYDKGSPDKSPCWCLCHHLGSTTPPECKCPTAAHVWGPNGSVYCTWCAGHCFVKNSHHMRVKNL